MIVIGLTGSIGMGKSATAKLFAERGVPVHDADAAVHQAYGKGGEAVAPLEWAFPGVQTPEGTIDRAILRERVIDDPEAMKRLEAIIHPIINEAKKSFLAKAQAKGADIVVLDVPLLFETGGDKRVDAVVVASAPTELQRQRVLARGGMSESDFEAILAKQTPDAEKRERADFVVNTAFGFDYAQVQVDEIIKALRDDQGGLKLREASCEKSHSTPKQPVSRTTKMTESSS